MIETIKWLKRSKWWKLLGFAAILTFGFINLTMVTTATSVGSLALKQKEVKDRSFVVFWKYQGKALTSFSGLPRVHAVWNGFTREVVPKTKNEVLKHPSHDALLKPLTSSSQHLIYCSLVFQCSSTWRIWIFWRGWTIFWVFYLFSDRTTVWLA